MHLCWLKLTVFPSGPLVSFLLRLNGTCAVTFSKHSVPKGRIRWPEILLLAHHKSPIKIKTELLWVLRNTPAET